MLRKEGAPKLYRDFNDRPKEIVLPNPVLDFQPLIDRVRFIEPGKFVQNHRASAASPCAR